MHNGCNSRGPCIRGFVRYVPRKRDGTRGGLVQSRFPSTRASPARPRGSNRSQGENVAPVGASSDGRYITGNKLSEDTQNREEGGVRGWMEASDEGFIGGGINFRWNIANPKGDGTSL